MNTIRAIRGMNDILPDETPHWQHLEAVMRSLMAGYGYAEIRLPVVEQTELFRRGVGEVTDIVEIPRSGSGTPVPCFATSARRKGVSDSSTRLVSRLSAWPRRIWTRK